MINSWGRMEQETEEAAVPRARILSVREEKLLSPKVKFSQLCEKRIIIETTRSQTQAAVMSSLWSVAEGRALLPLDGGLKEELLLFSIERSQRKGFRHPTIMPPIENRVWAKIIENFLFFPSLFTGLEADI